MIVSPVGLGIWSHCNAEEQQKLIVVNCKYGATDVAPTRKQSKMGEKKILVSNFAKT